MDPKFWIFSLFSVIILSFFQALKSIDCHILDSTTNLKDLPEYETNITEKIDELLIEKMADLESYRKRFEAYKLETISSSKTVTEESFHPIDCYHRLKRLSRYKNILLDLQEPEMEIQEIPDDEQLDVIINTIVRLQLLYKLPIEELINGTIKTLNRRTGSEETFQSAPLNFDDCFQIAKRTSNYTSLQSETILWAQQALRLQDVEAKMTGKESKIKYRKILLMMIARAYHKLGLNSKALETLNEASDLFHKPEAKDLVEKFKAKLRENPVDSPRDPKPAFERFSELCRGENPGPRDSTLHCFYRNPSTIRDSYYKLWRIKVEVLSKNPQIVLFHDAISDQEIEKVKFYSEDNLKLRVLRDINYSDQSYRMFSLAWDSDILIEDSYPFFDRLNRRVQGFTGLLTDNSDGFYSEALQMGNYGLGGLYEPHYDHQDSPAANPEVVMESDRIATWMFYLSDVTAGGATIFTVPGVTVFPKKGSAVFWYNLKASGAGDKNTKHGGCPVLIGSKWVANKWIREIGQAFRKPCSRNPEEMLVVEEGRD